MHVVSFRMDARISSKKVDLMHVDSSIENDVDSVLTDCFDGEVGRTSTPSYAITTQYERLIFSFAYVVAYSFSLIRVERP